MSALESMLEDDFFDDVDRGSPFGEDPSDVESGSAGFFAAEAAAAEATLAEMNALVGQAPVQDDGLFVSDVDTDADAYFDQLFADPVTVPSAPASSEGAAPAGEVEVIAATPAVAPAPAAPVVLDVEAPDVLDAKERRAEPRAESEKRPNRAERRRAAAEARSEQKRAAEAADQARKDQERETRSAHRAARKARKKAEQKAKREARAKAAQAKREAEAEGNKALEAKKAADAKREADAKAKEVSITFPEPDPDTERAARKARKKKKKAERRKNRRTSVSGDKAEQMRARRNLKGKADIEVIDAGDDADSSATIALVCVVSFLVLIYWFLT